MNLSIRRIFLDEGGYDARGRYYGRGLPLYRVESEDGSVDETLRARDRRDVERQVRSKRPAATILGDEDEDAVEEILAGYLEAAIWSSNDWHACGEGDNSPPMDRDHDVSDIASEARDKLRAVVEKFYRDNRDDVQAAHYPRRQTHTSFEMVGHDLWLTSNGHGAGFGDGDILPEEIDDRLRDAAKGVLEFNLYGHEGKVYC